MRCIKGEIKPDNARSIYITKQKLLHTEKPNKTRTLTSCCSGTLPPLEYNHFCK